jgi:hypothetical protein
MLAAAVYTGAVQMSLLPSSSLSREVRITSTGRRGKWHRHAPEIQERQIAAQAQTMERKQRRHAAPDAQPTGTSVLWVWEYSGEYSALHIVGTKLDGYDHRLTWCEAVSRPMEDTPYSLGPHLYDGEAEAVEGAVPCEVCFKRQNEWAQKTHKGQERMFGESENEARGNVERQV